jgi:type I site-specific restriction-modification system R (restriction) subunit
VTEPYSLRDDIIVISDEAHRTQAGQFAQTLDLVVGEHQSFSVTVDRHRAQTGRGFEVPRVAGGVRLLRTDEG